MKPPRVTAKVTVVNGKLVRQGLQNLDETIPKVGRAGIYKTLVEIQKQLQDEATTPPGKYPWKTLKQKRFVLWAIASGVLKRPYVRTHLYAKGYNIQAIKDGWILTNKVPYARWVGGTLANRQSKLHRGRWLRFTDVVQRGITKLPENIQKAIQVSKK